MIKAVARKGVIIPPDPLPEDWHEGTEVAIEKCPADIRADQDTNAADAWMDEVETIARQGDPRDDERLEAAIREVRHREKNLARRKLGLES